MAVILVVEDDIFARDVAEMMINGWDHQTLSASDVGEGLSVLLSSQHIDALFTDIYLKQAVLGGFDLARQAVAARPALRVLYTTGNSVTQQMRTLFVQGAQFLPKPYTTEQLQGSFEALFAA